MMGYRKIIVKYSGIVRGCFGRRKIHTYFYPSRVSELLGYTAEELTGKNLYALCHGEDANKLRKCHVDCKYNNKIIKSKYGIIDNKQ
jgi:hypothetical protein